MTKAIVFLTDEGACAHKSHEVGRLGSDDALADHQTLLRTKRQLQAREAKRNIETVLPEWDGDIKERAAVALGHRKAFSRFITRVEII